MFNVHTYSSSGCPKYAFYWFIVYHPLISSVIKSIMPLQLLIPSMRRVNVPSTSQLDSTDPHPLHALLDQLLLSIRSSRDKYHVELPQILSDGGGAGEAEETMMWFALNYEKSDGDDDRTRLSSSVHVEGPWANEVWRNKWLDRMERREYVCYAVSCMSSANHSQSSNPNSITLLEIISSRTCTFESNRLKAFSHKEEA